MKLAARNIVALVVPLAVVACAQLQGLDSYENVDCVGDDCVDAGNQPDTSTGNFDTGARDTGPACPACTNGQVCDPKTAKCVECLPGTKECAAGSFCDPDDTVGYKCVLGCGVADDCIKAGFGQDGGADGGDAGKAGDAGDAGAAGTIACCNNRCVDTSIDGKHCGMCGNSCGASGACCDSTCLDIVSTPTSCGGCGIVCSNNNITTPACGAKTCTGTCDDGWADCNMNKQSDGCETDIDTNPAKCGGCNKVCSSSHISTPVCTSGKCTGACDGTFRDCNGNKQVDGCEIDISNDKLNCGGCDNVCSNANIAPSCTGGVCDGLCNGGYKDCNNNKLVDGCEKHISGMGADVDNCGDCGVVCSTNHIATPTCNGACNGACDTGFGDCDNNKTVAGNGCETNVFTDANNCGTCGTKCSTNHVPAVCSNVGGVGKCSGACDSGWGDCNTNKQSDGCETDTTRDSSNCGTCAKVCAAGSRKCDASNCVAGSKYGVTTSPATFIDACAQAGMTRYFATAGSYPLLDDEVSPLRTVFGSGSFNFFGTTQTQYSIALNGEIAFGATAASTSNYGGNATERTGACPLPDTSTAGTMPLIWALGEDLMTRAGSGVCAVTLGAMPNRQEVITWKDAQYWNNGPTGDHLTFSVILTETANTIDIVYQTLDSAAGGTTPAQVGSSYVGVQQGGPTTTPVGEIATQYQCDESRATSGTKVRFFQ